MARTSKKVEGKKRQPPARTPEEAEERMISLAVALAEKKLSDGTAPAQVITHYLKLATSKEKLEKEKLARENELLTAKTEALKSQKRIEELYEDAIKAMKTYSGAADYDDEE